MYTRIKWGIQGGDSAAMCIFLRVFDIQNIYIDIYLYKRHSKCPRANIKLKVRKPHVHTQTTSIHHLAFHQCGEAFSRFVLSPRRRCIPSSEDGQIWPETSQANHATFNKTIVTNTCARSKQNCLYSIFAPPTLTPGGCSFPKLSTVFSVTAFTFS